MDIAKPLEFKSVDTAVKPEAENIVIVVGTFAALGLKTIVVAW